MTVEDCSHDLLRAKLEDKTLLQDIVEVIRCPGCYKCFQPTTDHHDYGWYLKETADPREDTNDDR